MLRRLMLRRLMPLPAAVTLQRAALTSLALMVAACGAKETRPETPLQYTENARKAYETALEAYVDKDWERADELFREVKRKYAYSRYARLAQLRMADAAFEQEKFGEAVSGYKTFIADYPNDPEVPYARYKIAKTQFSQSGASLLLPPLEERDLSNVRDAYATIRAYLGDYPGAEHTAELQYMLEVVTGQLVRHELYVARFYLRRDNFKAAVGRVEFALSQYDNSGLEPEAVVLLGETYLKMRELDRAREAFQLVLEKYPESAFTVPARRFLTHLESSTAAELP